MNGKFTPWDDAKIHVMAPGFRYGVGAFEGIRYYPSDDQKQVYIFRLAEHIDRLFRTAKVYRMTIPFTKEELISAHVETIRKNRTHGYGHLLPYAYLGYDAEHPTWGLGVGAPVHTMIIPAPMGATPLQNPYFHKDEYKVGIHCMVSAWERISPRALPPMAKMAGNYLNSFLAKMEAKANGYDEAIFLDNRGFVSEASAETVYAVKSGTLVTPPVAASTLEGITRNTVKVIGEDMGIPTIETDITRSELYCMDEMFLCASGSQIIPVTKIDHIPVGDGEVGPITNKMVEKYQNVTSGRDEKYRHWLSSVY